MTADVECPYCGVGMEINHDDGFGYDEDRRHEYLCSDCDKAFVFTTSISFYYEAFKADCLNGVDHNMEPVISTARDVYPDWKRCSDCEHEVRGDYVPLETLTEETDEGS